MSLMSARTTQAPRSPTYTWTISFSLMLATGVLNWVTPHSLPGFRPVTRSGESPVGTRLRWRRPSPRRPATKSAGASSAIFWPARSVGTLARYGLKQSPTSRWMRAYR